MVLRGDTVAEVEGGLGEKCLYCLKEICVIGWHVDAAGSCLSFTENDRKCLERRSLFPSARTASVSGDC